MFVLKVLIVVAVCVHFSDAKWRFRGRPRQCLKITDKTAPLCVDLSQAYKLMMLPNLLDHDTVDEVRQELAQWAPLVGSGCHPYLKHFLCSVYAPVCLIKEDPIGPCRSLCNMVRNSCEPVMKRHSNYTWPSMLNCSRYAEDVCISIPPPTPTAQPSICVDDDNSKFSLKKKFCEADFAFRGRVVERKERKGMVILKFKASSFLKQSKSLGKVKVLRVRLPVSNPSQCKGAQKRKQFLVLGTFKNKGRKMVVTHLLKWKKWKKNARKLNKKAC